MRLGFLLVVAIGWTTPTYAQPAPLPGTPGIEVAQSASQDAKDLDRIREALAKPAPSLILNVEVPATFKVEVNEQQKLDDLVRSMDFKSGPTPPGGVYGYEQQLRVFNPTNDPFMQPYAAFNGGELLTLAIEGVLGRAAGNAIDAFSKKAHARAQAAARAEVLRSIADYCAARPDKGADIPICQPAP